MYMKDAAAELKRLYVAAAKDARRSKPSAAADMDGPLNVMLVLTGVRRAARVESVRRGSALEAAVLRLAQRYPRRIAILYWGCHDTEPLILHPALLHTRDAIAITECTAENVSDLQEPVSGAMGRLLGYRCPYAGVGRWDARGTVTLEFYIMVDGIEQSGGWLAGFGCGQDVSQRAFRAASARASRDWQVKANLALAGTTFTAQGQRVVITRFVVTPTSNH